MKRVLDHIEKKQQELSRSSLLSFIADSTIEARERFAFVPCLAPFAKAFMDLKHVIQHDVSPEPVRQVGPEHGHEEDEHWLLFVKDLRTLSTNMPMDLASVLRMLWGKHCQRTRVVACELTNLVTRHPDPRIRLLIVEAVEGCADVAFDAFCKATEDFEAQTGKKLHYFAKTHDTMQANHTRTRAAVEKRMDRDELTEEQCSAALDAVDAVYTLFQGMFDELLEYALWMGNFRRDMSAMGKWAEVSCSTASL
jgi:hypothetical protein